MTNAKGLVPLAGVRASAEPTASDASRHRLTVQLDVSLVERVRASVTDRLTAAVSSRTLVLETEGNAALRDQWVEAINSVNQQGADGAPATAPANVPATSASRPGQSPSIGTAPAL